MANSGARYGTQHLIERQVLLSDVLRKAIMQAPSSEPGNRFRFVTISRDRGSLGDAIAYELAGHIGWHVFDKEIVNYIAQNAHVRESLVRQLDEHSHTLMQDTIQRFLEWVEGGAFGREDYYDALLKTLAYLAGRGEAIIIGRGSNFALHRERNGLHVRITASPEVRTERLSKRWAVSLEEARRRMLALDSERKQFVRWHFHQDVDDPAFYHAVYNTDHLEPGHVVASMVVMISLAVHGLIPVMEPTAELTR
jgi:hypothetical protein